MLERGLSKKLPLLPNCSVQVFSEWNNHKIGHRVFGVTVQLLYTYDFFSFLYLLIHEILM